MAITQIVPYRDALVAELKLIPTDKVTTGQVGIIRHATWSTRFWKPIQLRC